MPHFLSASTLSVPIFHSSICRKIAIAFMNEGKSPETLAEEYECTPDDIRTAIRSHVDMELKEPPPSPLRPHRCACDNPLPTHTYEMEIDSSDEDSCFPADDDDSTYVPSEDEDDEDDTESETSEEDAEASEEEDADASDEEDTDADDDSTYVPSEEGSDTKSETSEESEEASDASSEASLDEEEEKPHIRRSMQINFHREYENYTQSYYDQLIITPQEGNVFEVKFVYDRMTEEHKTYDRSYFTATSNELFVYLKNVFKMVQLSRHPYEYIDVDITFFPSFTVYSSDLKKKSVQRLILRAVKDYVSEFISTEA